MLALKDRLNDAMSCDSLTFGGNAFQSLLARNVKDRCINSRLKGGNQSFNVQSCSVNIVGYWPRSFLRFF